MTETVDKLGAHEVAAWLRRHPGFLKQFPDLALTLVVPRDDGPTASLASYQLEVLREKNRELARRLADLGATAQVNERLAVRTHQLTLALTTRFLNGLDGAEKMSASLGQILYFRDREVTLPGEATETESDSPYVGELTFHPSSALDLTANARYNAHDDITEVFNTRLRYHPGQDKSVTLGYRLRNELDEQQADVAAYWPLTHHWQLLGRWQYDLEAERNLDVVAGLEYRSCCWGVRMVSRELLNTTTNELEHSIYFTFEFKGLSRIGNELDSELERGILGG